MCAAPKGNQFWKLRYRHGTKKAFETPQILWDAACEYFEWAENNPLIETKAFNFQGEIIYAKIPKLRAMSLNALCLYLGCNEAYFRNFKSQPRTDKKDFSTVIELIEKTIYDQKFTGASADMLNANIIARDLGLADNQKHEIKGGLNDLKLPKFMEKGKK